MLRVYLRKMQRLKYSKFGGRIIVLMAEDSVN